MSAGYDGKTIIWDIWEGIPVRIHETGRFKLVDGKFSPDGTSLVLSDEVGQIFIIATGQGESQKDAQYDQFFLGDYRPLIQDTNGNVLDQETQLIPYRRNMQDLLCDSSMIPYPEPYQSMYQKRRLGALGIEWRPPSVKLAVGPNYNVSTGDYQILPIVDLDRLADPLPEIVDVIDWDQDNELQSDDTDSEYNVTDENLSEGEHDSLSFSSTGEAEFIADDSDVDQDNKEAFRRSKRKKYKSEVEITTSSGRRVKRRSLVEPDEANASRMAKARRARKGRTAARKRKSMSSRPQRRAARNALNLFSKISGGSSDGEEELDFESSSSESEALLPDSNTQSNESEISTKVRVIQYGKGAEMFREECDEVAKPSLLTSNLTNNGNKRRLVLKLKTSNFSGTTRLECLEQDTVLGSPPIISGTTYSDTCEKVSSSVGRQDNLISQYGTGIKPRERGRVEMPGQIGHPVELNASMSWGEVKQRSSKRMRLCDTSLSDIWTGHNASVIGSKISGSAVNGNLEYFDHSTETSNCKKKTISEGLVKVGGEMNQTSENLDDGNGYAANVFQDDQAALPLACSLNRTEVGDDVHISFKEDPMTNQHRNFNEPKMADCKHASSSDNVNDAVLFQEKLKAVQSAYPKLRIRTNGFDNETDTFKSVGCEDWCNSEDDLISESAAPINRNVMSIVPEEEGTTGDSAEFSDWNNESDNLGISAIKSSSRKYSAVYRRLRSSRGRKNSNAEMKSKEGNNSDSYNHCVNMRTDSNDALVEGGQGRRSMIADADDYAPVNASKFRGNLLSNGQYDRQLISKARVGLRSVRNRRENHSDYLKPIDRRRCQQVLKKFSWLMLSEHEEAYRYIPQKGDQVAYVSQGHDEYLERCNFHDVRPWRIVKGSLKAVEFCKVKDLEYSTVSGSGESCCKLTLEFVDPSSAGFGSAFRLTLPELESFPDFIVELTRYHSATARNWTHRDKCQVWWKNEDGNGGSWWEGRIMSVKPKSPEFPDSPWERYTIQYKNDSSQHLHSPWELYDADSLWDHPRIDDWIRNKLFSSLNKLEQASVRNQDAYGIQKINQVSQKSEFLNRFPVPLSLDIIKKRLQNNYYRNVDAVKHDISVMVSNAESYFARSVEMSSKIRRLADWVATSISSL